MTNVIAQQGLNYQPGADWRTSRRAPSRSGRLAAWLVFGGALFPGGVVTINMLGPKLTVGRIGILLLLIPALIKLTRANRRLILSDYLVCMAAAWMIGTAAYTGDGDDISSAAAESIEYAGGYFVARGLLFGYAALTSMTKVLKIVALVAISLALADNLSGRLVTYNTLAQLSGSASLLGVDFRMGMVRAASTFDHPILFGTFCSITGIIFLSTETASKRILWVGLCLFGCFLSLSSAPMLFFLLAIATFAYDKLMKQFPWRWSAFWIAISAVLLVIFVVTNHPIGWIISHLTLDPESGYFRLLIWDTALPKIAEEPWTGYAFNSLDDYILDYTVDCVWLTLALRFGVPLVVLIILTNITAILPSGAPEI